jgi:glycosyltransferase involved in cell wall biosynthesis
MPEASPLRILFLTRSLGFGGAERQLVELARVLHVGGHQVTVAEFYGPGPLASELVTAGVRVISLEKRGRWDLLHFAGNLVDHIRREKPQVLHSYLPEPNIIASLVKARFPRLKVVWGVRASNMDFRRYGLVSRASFASTVVLSRIADAIIANSEVGAAFHAAHGYPTHTMHVVPNGIDTVRFQPDSSARAKERAALSVAEDTLVIGAMGRLDVMKDHPTFLRAAALFSKSHSGPVKFVITGAGPADYVARMRHLASELGLADCLAWLDTRPDAERILNACDIMTSTSAFGEGFPNVIGEAMACGVPCVATDVGDTARVLGQEGVLVPVAAPERVAAGWTSLAERRSPALSARCREHIVSEFSVDRLAERTVAVLRTVVAQ